MAAVLRAAQRANAVERKGLGRNEDGIPQALRPKLKFDATGVGYDPGEQFTNHWWQNVYNNAASNVRIRKNKDGVEVETEGEAVDITTSKHIVSKLKKNRKLKFGNFLQTSTLTEGGEVNIFPAADEPAEAAPSLTLPDEVLFEVCGGRTVHKAARHGMKLNGKLARVEAQERTLLKCLRLETSDAQHGETTARDASSNDAWAASSKRKRKKKKRASSPQCVENAVCESSKKKSCSSPQCVENAVCEGSKKKSSSPQCVENAVCEGSKLIDNSEIQAEGATNKRTSKHKHKKKKSHKEDRSDESVGVTGNCSSRERKGREKKKRKSLWQEDETQGPQEDCKR